MSTRQATPRGYLSGHCGQTRQHDRCRGAYAGAACRCGCHRAPASDPTRLTPTPPALTCPTCGQPQPTTATPEAAPDA